MSELNNEYGVSVSVIFAVVAKFSTNVLVLLCSVSFSRVAIISTVPEPTSPPKLIVN